MPHILRSILKRYIHPPLLRLYRRIAGGVRFSGNYATWEEASRHATGYDSPEIIRRVTEAALKVRNGEALFERDSVLFDKPQYSWPVIAGLLWIAAQKGNRLNIVDFGGSLGSSYFQARRFLSPLEACRWSVVEQKHFVETGRRYFEDDHLRFYDELDACIDREKPDAMLLSSVLQYLRDPGHFIDTVVEKGLKFILIDRTPFFLTGKDRLTVQKVPSWIYPASYPAWIMNLDRFQDRFAGSYDLIADFESPDTANIPAEFKGFLYRRKDRA
jgi:putative methyltransferase (TIGR04325 family)